MSDQERPMEPSDAERAEWPQATTAYVEWLETAVEELDFLRHEGGPDSVSALEDENKRLRAQLEWYGDKALLSKSEGTLQDSGISALRDDGGQRARQALKGGDDE